MTIDLPGWSYVKDTMSYLHDSGSMVVWQDAAHGKGWYGYTPIQADNHEQRKTGPHTTAQLAAMNVISRRAHVISSRSWHERSKIKQAS